eukprot:scaffold579_cov546-Prasinococcus_capsulatus_cf.AAC.7
MTRASDSIREGIARLRRAFRAAKAADQQSPEGERLGTKAFVIEQSLYDSLVKEGREETERLLEKIDLDNKVKEIQAHRIREECWNSMKVHAAGLTPLHPSRSGFCVTNYPIELRRHTPAISKLNIIRAVELKEALWQQKNASVAVAGSHGMGEPSTSLHSQSGFERVTASGLKEDASTEDDGNEDVESTGFETKNQGPHMRSLLYGDYELVTRRRKQTQILLLSEQLLDLRQNFNQCFEGLRMEKDRSIDKIADLNERIASIATELDVQVDVITPCREIPVHGCPGSESTDLLSSCSRKEQSEDTLKHNKETEIHDSRLTNAKTRALKDMMGGSLDSTQQRCHPTRSTVGAEVLNASDSGAHGSATDLTRGSEGKEKASPEEKDKKYKALEAELKRLKNDVLETCQHFESALNDLCAQRLLCDVTIHEAEHRILRLCLQIEEEMSQARQERDILQKLDRLKVKRAESIGLVQKHQNAVEDLSERAQQPYEDEDLESTQTLLVESTNRLNELRQQDEEYSAQVEETLRTLTQLRKEQVHDRHDLELPLRLKQGQLEISWQQGKHDTARVVHVACSGPLRVIGFYLGVAERVNDALLVKRCVIEAENLSIVHHGQEKIQVMTAIKDCKKDICGQIWKNKRLDMLADHLVARTKEFQLLRVTRSLQVRTCSAGRVEAVSSGLPLVADAYRAR